MLDMHRNIVVNLIFKDLMVCAIGGDGTILELINGVLKRSDKKASD